MGCVLICSPCEHWPSQGISGKLFLSSDSSLTFFLSLLVLKILCCHGQVMPSQKFRVAPYDMTVLEGAEALLRCEVSNLAGNIQWTKDGFALGKQKIDSLSKKLSSKGTDWGFRFLVRRYVCRQWQDKQYRHLSRHHHNKMRGMKVFGTV